MTIYLEMPNISLFKRERIIQLRAEGESRKNIAEELSVSRCGVQKVLKKHNSGVGIQNITKTL